MSKHIKDLTFDGYELSIYYIEYENHAINIKDPNQDGSIASMAGFTEASDAEFAGKAFVNGIWYVSDKIFWRCKVCRTMLLPTRRYLNQHEKCDSCYDAELDEFIEGKED